MFKIMLLKRISTIFIALIMFASAASAGTIIRGPDQPVSLKVFYHEKDKTGLNAFLIGKIESIGMNEEFDKKDISAIATGKSKASVRIYTSEGVKEGDEYFVINDKNLIVSRLQAKFLYKSLSFGPMMIACGNLRLAKTGNRVVQKVEDNYSKYAYIYAGRGDYFQATGDEGEAINNYKKAIELDRGNPEAHLALGQIYLKQEMLQFAFKEFSEAYKRISRLYDKEDRYALLKGMTKTRYKQAYETRAVGDKKTGYIKDGIRYAEEALKVYPESAESHFYLGMLHYKNPERSDIKTRDHLIKAIELNAQDRQYIEANLILSELYKNHGNIKKAIEFADRALQKDSSNQRARQLKKIYESE